MAAIRATTVEPDRIAVVACLRANALPITTYRGANILSAYGTPGTFEAALDLAERAAPIARVRVVIIAAFGVAPKDAPTITAFGEACVEAADTRALRV